MSKFKVGDRVYEPGVGFGVVTKVPGIFLDSVVVEFEEFAATVLDMRLTLVAREPGTQAEPRYSIYDRSNGALYPVAPGNEYDARECARKMASTEPGVEFEVYQLVAKYVGQAVAVEVP